MAAGRKNAVKKPPESASHGRRHGRHGFDPWVEKIPWGRAWQPTPVFSPGKSHGQRSLEGYSPWGCRVTAEAEGSAGVSGSLGLWLHVRRTAGLLGHLLLSPGSSPFIFEQFPNSVLCLRAGGAWHKTQMKLAKIYRF